MTPRYSTRTRRSAAPGEQSLIRDIMRFCNATPSRRYPLTIGDDAAVRRCTKGESLVLTTDVLVEGVDFSLDYMTLREVGFKAMAANLSDCAAMGAMPESALVQVTFPASHRGVRAAFRNLYRGIGEACRLWRFAVVGGDISSGPAWSIGVTLIGRQPDGLRVLQRSGARHGDGVWVSGCVGESAAGLEALRKWGRNSVPAKYRRLVRRHVRPTPQIALGAALVRNRHVHAAMDISDGLSKDCAVLAGDSGLGAVLESGRMLISAGTRRLARELKTDPMQWLLHGGEDFELLFAASPAFDPVEIERARNLQLTRIGRLDKVRRGVVLTRPDGRTRPLRDESWDHTRAALL